MRLSKQVPNNKRQMYLSLVSRIGAQLREAYAERYEQGVETQSSIARKLGIDRSTVNRRLKGHTNMTIQTLAEMVWALGNCIDIDIFDPQQRPTNEYRITPIATDDVLFGAEVRENSETSKSITKTRNVDYQFETVIHG